MLRVGGVDVRGAVVEVGDAADRGVVVIGAGVMGRALGRLLRSAGHDRRLTPRGLPRTWSAAVRRRKNRPEALAQFLKVLTGVGGLTADGGLRTADSRG